MWRDGEENDPWGGPPCGKDTFGLVGIDDVEQIEPDVAQQIGEMNLSRASKTEKSHSNSWGRVFRIVTRHFWKICPAERLFFGKYENNRKPCFFQATFWFIESEKEKKDGPQCWDRKTDWENSAMGRGIRARGEWLDNKQKTEIDVGHDRACVMIENIKMKYKQE